MLPRGLLRIFRTVFPLVVLITVPAAFVRGQAIREPWTVAQTVKAEDLAKELRGASPAPTILFVGFRRLYNAGHIKGAEFHGTAGNADGLEEMKKWAGSLPRSTSLVIYCGCCPMENCPNLRPAFVTLRDMGFTHLRILVLPDSFAVDWAQKGLPYEKGPS